jgi:hypothetical protein
MFMLDYYEATVKRLQYTTDANGNKKSEYVATQETAT